MVDPSALYSYKGSEPSILPHRITLSDGRSRTDNTTFTDEEIFDAGFTGPYEKPIYNQSTQEIFWNNKTLMWDINDKNIQEPQVIEKTEEELFYELRRKRNFLLSASDWTQTLDSPLSDEERKNWQLYRQELRDLPKTISIIKDFDIENHFPKPKF